MLHYYQRCQKTLFFRRKHLFIHVEVAIVDRPLIIRKCGHNNGNGYSHYNKGNVYHHHDKGDDVYHHHDKGICYQKNIDQDMVTAHDSTITVGRLI